MKARIYRPSKSTMQSGRGHLRNWVVEVETNSDRAPEPLMGWVSSSDTRSQVSVKFPTLAEAEQFAQDKGFDYTILQANERTVKPRNYVDNFKYIPPQKSKDKKK